jgi:hypothetical protein
VLGGSALLLCGLIAPAVLRSQVRQLEQARCHRACRNAGHGADVRRVSPVPVQMYEG